MSKIATAIRRDLWERCAETCEACGFWLSKDDMHAHHRKLRSQGGLDELSNLLAVHHACHRSLHLYPERSYELGHLVRSYDDPGDVPVVLYPPMFAARRRRQVTVPDPTSPDCEVGKHGACSGDAWDLLKDKPADCTCDCHRRAA